MTPNVPTTSSQCDTSACVEVTWRKSTLSAENGACVEVGWRKVDRPGTKGQTDER